MTTDVTRTDSGDALTPDETARLEAPRQILELLGQMHERCHLLDSHAAALEQSDPELFIALQRVHHFVQVAGEYAAAHLTPTNNDDGRPKRTLARKRFRRPDRRHPR